MLLVIGALLTPAWVFFSHRDGLVFLEGADWQRANRLLFPLVGLYAFTLVWLQVMIGSNRRWLSKLLPSILRYHRVEGVFAFFFANLHPILLINGVGFTTYLRDEFVAPDQVLFVWFGRTALFLIVLTVLTALLWRLSCLRQRWHAIHYLNYLVFVLVWVHSWNLGPDVRTTSLRWLWVAYGLAFVASVLGRIITAARRPQVASPSAAPLTPPPSETPSA